MRVAIYDFIFTIQLPVMTPLFVRAAELPFAPLVGWPIGDGRWLRIGFDLLLATAFPLVMRKAFGKSAGHIALVTALAASPPCWCSCPILRL